MLKTVSRKSTQRGITGLETAIILIAFVVVASVFAFTVLSTGIFTSERSKETVLAGIEETKRSLEPVGRLLPARRIEVVQTLSAKSRSSFRMLLVANLST